MKNTGRKIVKIAKGIGIGYLVVGVIVIFALVFGLVVRTSKYINKLMRLLIKQMRSLIKGLTL